MIYSVDIDNQGRADRKRKGRAEIEFLRYSVDFHIGNIRND